MSAFESLFKKALTDNAQRYDGIPQRAEREEFDQKYPQIDSVVMNIASVSFKVIGILSFPRNEATQSLFIYDPTQDNKEEQLEESYGDFANMTLGQVNRFLSKEFRFSGISTPMILKEDKVSSDLYQKECTEKFFFKAIFKQGGEVGLSVLIESGSGPVHFQFNEHQDTHQETIKEPGVELSMDSSELELEAGALELF